MPSENLPRPLNNDVNHNLLFGLMAWQLDFIDREELTCGIKRWLETKQKLLASILVDRQSLSASQREVLEALIDEHVRQHAGDVTQSLAVVSSIGPVLSELKALGDSDLNESLTFIAADPFQTINAKIENQSGSPSVGQHGAAETRFRILRPHAKGGLGSVSVAMDGELSREVALKEMQSRFADDENLRARFRFEAEVTGRLEHPGVVPVYGLGHFDDGRPFYAMRFVRGDSLQDAITRFYEGANSHHVDVQNLDTNSFRNLLRRLVDICNAIAYAHSRGVLHRDLKPGNVMLGKYGETLVVDWGLAKTVAGDEIPCSVDESIVNVAHRSGSSPTAMGSVVGTPAYMSPEQAAGKLDQVGPLSDVYSLGATLYAILTGRAPFLGKTSLQEVIRGDFPTPQSINSQVANPLEAICLKAMSKDPQERYSSPLELAKEIEAFLAGEPVQAYRESIHERTRRWSRDHPRIVTAISATTLTTAVSIAAILAIVFFKNQDLSRLNGYLVESVTETRRQLRNSQILRLRRDALDTLDPDLAQPRPQRGLLLASEAVEINRRVGEPVLPHTQRVLSDILSQCGGHPVRITGPVPSRDCIVSPDHRWILGFANFPYQMHQDPLPDSPVRAVLSRTLLLIDLDTASPQSHVLFDSDAELVASEVEWRSTEDLTIPTCQLDACAFTPDGKWLAVVYQKRIQSEWQTQLAIWSLREQFNPDSPDHVLAIPVNRDGGIPFASVEFSDNGRRLAVGTRGGLLRTFAWSAAGPGDYVDLADHGDPVMRLRFNHDGTMLAGLRSPSIDPTLFESKEAMPVPTPIVDPSARLDAVRPIGISDAFLTGSDRVFLVSNQDRNAIESDEILPVDLDAPALIAPSVVHHASLWGAPLERWTLGLGAAQRMEAVNVQTFDFFPESSLLVAGSGDGSIRVWRRDCEDAEDNTRVETVEMGAGQLVMRRCGKEHWELIALPARDDMLQASSNMHHWRFNASGEMEDDFVVHQYGIEQILAWSDTAELTYLAIVNGQLAIIDPSIRNSLSVADLDEDNSGGKAFRETKIYGHEAPIEVAMVSQNDASLLTLDGDGEVRRWQLVDGFIPRSGSEEPVFATEVFSTEGFNAETHHTESGRMALATPSGRILVYDPERADPVWVVAHALKLPVGSGVDEIRFSHDGQLLFWRNAGGELFRWDANSDSETQPERVMSGLRLGSDFHSSSRSDRYIVGLTKASEALLIDLAAPASQKSISLQIPRELIKSIGQSADAKSELTGPAPPRIGYPLVQDQTSVGLGIESLCVSEDGSRIAIAWDKRVAWIHGSKPMGYSDEFETESLALDPLGRWLVSASHQTASPCIAWNLDSDPELSSPLEVSMSLRVTTPFRIQAKRMAVGVRLDPNSRRYESHSAGILVWQLSPNGPLEPRLLPVPERVMEVVVSPDGNLLAGFLDNGETLVWEISDLQAESSLQPVQQTIPHLFGGLTGFFTNQNSNLLVAGWGGVSRIELTLESLLERAANIAGRDFTDYEINSFQIPSSENE